MSDFGKFAQPPFDASSMRAGRVRVTPRLTAAARRVFARHGASVRGLRSGAALDALVEAAVEDGELDEAALPDEFKSMVYALGVPLYRERREPWSARIAGVCVWLCRICGRSNLTGRDRHCANRASHVTSVVPPPHPDDWVPMPAHVIRPGDPRDYVPPAEPRRKRRN